MGRLAECVKAGLEATKSWPIRTQVLRLELGVLVVILLVINFFVVFNILYLRSQTLAEVRNRADVTTDQNLLQLANVLGKVMGVYLESCLMFLGTVQSAYAELSSSHFSQLPSRTYGELPQSCMQRNQTLYGDHPVCVQQSSFKALGPVNNSTLSESAQLDYVLPALSGLSAAGANMLRLQLYFNSSNFIRIFPGSFVPTTYQPESQPWFQALQDNLYKPTVTGVYSDTLGSGQDIFSVVVPLYSRGNGVGAMSLDLQVSSALSVLQFAAYSENGEAVLVGRDKKLFPDPNNRSFNRTLPASVFEARPGEVMQLDDQRAAVVRIPDSDDWSALLIVLVPDSVGSDYSELEADDMDSAAGWLLVISVFSSLLVLVAVALCLCFYTRRLTSPLHEVIRMARGLHKTATSRHALKQTELDAMEEGEDSVQQLVQVFKQLATQLVTHPNHVPHRSMVRSRFPQNELQGKAPWRQALRYVS